MTYKLLSILLLAMMLLGAPSSARMNNYTVLGTFSDGQAEHIIQNRILNSPRPDPFWTCPPDQLQPRSVPAVAPEDDVAPSPPCKISRPKLIYERIEMWLNPYGQVIKMRYLSRYREQDKKIIYKIPENETEVTAGANWQSYYMDTNGSVVSYYAKQVIPSKKHIRSPVNYSPGYAAEQARTDLNMTRREFMDIKNQDRIRRMAYNHSSEVKAQRIKELERKLEKANNTLNRQENIINRILNWILKTFGIDLR